ncbi:MAG TPA: alkaline phosphatase family protein, partial [Xanthomonadales bacterium]|nr:alkaline phosphatase family protein [Xanthomonadales bacterium]
PAVYTGSLWPTVWTGTRPGRHACYYNEQIIPGTYKIGDFLGPDVKQEPFWNTLSRSGCRVGLFDVPKAPLCETLNGVQIVDWGTHDADLPACSWPPQLIEEITAKHGPSAFRRCDWVMDGENPEQTLRELLLQRMETRLAIARDLLQREAWDLFMIGFGESHCIGHQCWHLHDPSHPKHDATLLRRIGDPVRDVYLALDRALGQLLEYTDAGTTVVLHCSHGMSAHYDATYLLDRALRRLEGKPQPAVGALLARARRLWKRLPLRLTERFGDLASAVRRMPDVSDRASRDCFVVPTNANSAGIRLNLAGREPNGRIQPKDADDFIARLTTDLQEFTDPADGRKLVKEIIRSSIAFPGEHSDSLPDLFIRWNRDKPITGLSSPKIGSLIEEDHSTRRSGDHRPGGLIFLHGPGYAAGTQLPDVHDEDIAPTLAACLGVNLAGVDGQPILPLQGQRPAGASQV